MRGSTRDWQRSKLYKAERVLAGFPAPQLWSVRTIQEFADRVLAHAKAHKYVPADKLEPWYRGRSGELPRRIVVKDGRGRRIPAAWVTDSIGYITLPRHARDFPTVLHEIAHTFQTQEPGHGRQFCGIFADLVEQYIGDEARRALVKSYHAHGVKWTRRKNPHDNRR